MDRRETNVREVRFKRTKKPFKGIRKRKWGKWIAEIREPKTSTRHWLGSYVNSFAAARAYDTAAYCLRGLKAKFNLPELVDKEALDKIKHFPPTVIKARARDAGSEVDRIDPKLASTSNNRLVKLMAQYHCQVEDYLDELDAENAKMANKSITSPGVTKNPDLNKQPEPEDIDIM